MRSNETEKYEQAKWNHFNESHQMCWLTVIVDQLDQKTRENIFLFGSHQLQTTHTEVLSQGHVSYNFASTAKVN